MKCDVIFQGVEKTPFLHRFSEEKVTTAILERFNAFSGARVIFSKEGDNIAVRCCLYRDGLARVVTYEANTDAYSALDSVVEKLERALSRKMGKGREGARHWATA